MLRLLNSVYRVIHVYKGMESSFRILKKKHLKKYYVSFVRFIHDMNEKQINLNFEYSKQIAQLETKYFYPLSSYFKFLPKVEIEKIYVHKTVPSIVS